MAEFFYYKNEVLLSKSKKVQIYFIFELGETELNLDLCFFFFFSPRLCPKLLQLTEFLLNNSILFLS